MERDTHAETALATAGAILIAKRTDDLIVGLRDGEGGCQGRSRGHRRQHGFCPSPTDNDWPAAAAAAS